MSSERAYNDSMCSTATLRDEKISSIYKSQPKLKKVEIPTQVYESSLQDSSNKILMNVLKRKNEHKRHRLLSK